MPRHPWDIFLLFIVDIAADDNLLGIRVVECPCHNLVVSNCSPKSVHRLTLLSEADFFLLGEGALPEGCLAFAKRLYKLHIIEVN